jgi:hypothetical protein
LELYERVGDLIPTADARYFMENLALMLRSRLLALPDYVSQFHRGKDMSDAEFGELVDVEVRKILEEAGRIESYDAPLKSPGGTILLEGYAESSKRLLAENKGVQRWREIYEKAKHEHTGTAEDRDCPPEGTSPGEPAA